jgi:Arc/MetJ-type ribon-helix-helix transcriptional regulator
MTIEITRPELEALIQERLRSGGFEDAQDVILSALRAAERSSSADELLAALQSPPQQDAGEAPAWLQESWANARESGLANMTIEEIDDEITFARLSRHQPRP